MRLSLPPQSSGAVAPCPGLPSFLQLPRPLAFMTDSLDAAYRSLHAGSCQQELGYEMGVYTENVLPVCLPSVNLCLLCFVLFFGKNSVPVCDIILYLYLKRWTLSPEFSPQVPRLLSQRTARTSSGSACTKERCLVGIKFV